ncbi:acyltransferase family protein [Pedobacter rhizosphaerae]|uniref:Peptidoglycan/LPS O-acetylase OafA/YrhL, contains acyltransferase and SGNH-hydrolase domains n=1 Tax=Pedobacter rhizosphaerae TaxID=390241 RepID=A0A1H9NDQ2_9SPHI|nr:acyltransferase [Pedobacter rhizosphaerae]SER33981.1 Peptidoglycan/LPS O-acetylase OafA/YrhL, contains acyltransferase and SGNH-hydrolase domains [Pedobacter rhizosphaerae]
MPLTKVTGPTLNTRPHFAILDGLRGIAAIAVVIYHFMEIAVPDYHQSFIAHAHLAVDFFFCLSGFVIAYAYDHKLKQLGLALFMKLRLIRLHPLVIIGSVIGLLVFVYDPFSNLYQAYADRTPLMFITSCLMIPYPLVHERYFNLFHLNPPTWSLFWEYIANMVYALVLIRLRNKAMWALVGIAAVAICYESFHAGSLAVGWGGDNIVGGGIRVAYSFLAGILVYRSNWVIKSRLGFLSIGLFLIAVFVIPFSEKTNAVVDILLVLFYFPFLIALGAGAQLKKRFSKICKWSGEISYPLYVIHYPFIWLFMSYVEQTKPNMQQMSGMIIFGVLALITLAYGILVFVDIPIRNYLKKVWIKDSPRKTEKSVVVFSVGREPIDS